MTDTSRIRTTIKTERVSVVFSRHAVRGWCEYCGHEVELLAVEDAREFLESRPDIARHRGLSKLHMRELKEGLFVCLRSLRRLIPSSDSPKHR